MQRHRVQQRLSNAIAGPAVSTLRFSYFRSESFTENAGWQSLRPQLLTVAEPPPETSAQGYPTGESFCARKRSRTSHSLGHNFKTQLVVCRERFRKQ